MNLLLNPSKAADLPSRQIVLPCKSTKHAHEAKVWRQVKPSRLVPAFDPNFVDQQPRG